MTINTTSNDVSKQSENLQVPETAQADGASEAAVESAQAVAVDGEVGDTPQQADAGAHANEAGEAAVESAQAVAVDGEVGDTPRQADADEAGSGETTTDEVVNTTAKVEGGAGSTPPPPSRPLTGFLWVLPVLALIVAVLVIFLRRRRHNDSQLSEPARDIVPRRVPSPRPAAPQKANEPVVPSTRIPPRVVPASTNGDSAIQEQSSETEVANETEISSSSAYCVGFAQTQGSRADQEDSYVISNWRDGNVIQRQGLLAAVADGIGGLDDGQIASNTLMRSFCEEFPHIDPDLPAMDRLLELMARGQQEVLRINRAGKRCGTTLVAMLIQDDFLSTLSVGDSRIALYRAGTLLQLNREHVLSRESDEQQAMTREGSSPNARQRGAITSYIGMEGLRQIDRTLNPIRLVAGDRVLLMSDGVFGTLNDDEIISFLNRKPENAAREIINAVETRKKPHQDNATIVIVGLN